MSRWTALLVALLGCQPAADCPARDAGGPDVPDAPLRLDAPRDAPPPDGCVAVSPARLVFGWAYGAHGATDTRPCPGAYRYYVYSAATGTLVWSRTDPLVTDCYTGTELPPGEYDIAVDLGDDRRWLAGGEYLRPERCDRARPTPAFCGAVRVSLDPCEIHLMTTTVFCDPAEGECPTGLPWERLPP